MSEFTIHVSDVQDDGKDYEFPLTATWIEGALADAELRAGSEPQAGSLQVHVQRNGVELLVTGHIQADLVGRCIRCLEDAPIAIDSDFVALLARDDQQATQAAAVELQMEDLDRGTYSGEDLVLDGMVVEHLLVECPMQPLCREDCKGLEVPAHIRPPADFGAKEQGVDPRLAPLLKLKDKVLPNKE